jgi:hypothetical protein
MIPPAVNPAADRDRLIHLFCPQLPARVCPQQENALCDGTPLPRRVPAPRREDGG